jgi:queuine tRNA-ribosyltransferase
MLFTTQGIINIDNKKWEFDHSPIDEGLENETSTYYSKSYLRHLMKSKELLGLNIASVQNLAFYLWLVTEARKHIVDGNFSGWKANILPIITRRL